MITAAWNDIVHNPRSSTPRAPLNGMTDETRCNLKQHCGGNRPPHRARAIAVGIIFLALELISASAAAAAPNLVSVVIRGSTVYDAPVLFDLYRDQLGKPVTVDGARAIAAAVIRKYETDGYSRPQAKLD